MTTHSNELNQQFETSFDWAEGFKKSIPVAMGYLPAGIAFGVLAQVAGIPLWAVIMLSVVLYAGAAQYACLPMLSAGLPIGNIATNIAAINLRHVFYGMPLLHYLPKQKLARTYCLFALTDETFSIITSLPNESKQALMLPISLFNQSWWVLASVIGVMIGSALSDLVPHLDFALVCLFAILAYEQFQSIKRYFPIVIAVISLAIASLFTSNWLLLVAITICMLMILARGFWTQSNVVGDSNDQ